MLSLLLPGGFSTRCAVIGSACPPALADGSQVAGERFDLAILSPNAGECAAAGWLAEAVAAISARLDADGLVYLLAPRGSRGQAQRLLQQQGFQVAGRFIHLPGLQTSRWVVPLIPAPARYMLGQMAYGGRRTRAIARLALRIPGIIALLARLHPAAGIAFSRNDPGRLATWLLGWDGTQRAGSIALERSWREEGGPVIARGFMAGRGEPVAVAKVVPGGAPAEAELLASLGEAARRAGARVPAVLTVQARAGSTALVLTPLPGSSLARLLAEQPSRLEKFAEQVSGWLARWNRSTCHAVTLSDALFKTELLQPACLLAPFLQGGVEYVRKLEQDCSALQGNRVNLVAAHGDLTCSNILWSQSEGMGVLDWESARRQALPLLDFYYFLVAAVAIQAKTSRLDACQACFTPAGRLAGLARRLQQSIEAAAEVEPAFARLCFHACWLRHAADEHRKVAPGEKRPFLEIVQWLAAGGLA